MQFRHKRLYPPVQATLAQTGTFYGCLGPCRHCGEEMCNAVHGWVVQNVGLLFAETSGARCKEVEIWVG